MEAVHDSLGRLDGVHSVSIDLQKNLVTITPAPDRTLDLAGVAEAIKRAGFKTGRMSVRASARSESTSDGRRVRIRGWPETFPWSGEPTVEEGTIVASVDYSTHPPTLAPLR